MPKTTFADFLRNSNDELITDDISGGLSSAGKMLRAQANIDPKGTIYSQPLDESAKIADLSKNNQDLEDRFKRILNPDERVTNKEVGDFLGDLSRHTSFATSLAVKVKDNVRVSLIEDIDRGAYIVERMLNAFEAGVEAGKQQGTGRSGKPTNWRAGR